MGTFTDRLWDETKQIRAAIDELDFLQQLGAGTLPLDVFRTYIEQDALYLEGYTRALALLAARSPDPGTAGFWATASATAATVELSLHNELLTGGSLPPATGTPTHSTACLAYVSYLIATAATESYPVAVAAALPCFWIYAEVGRRLAAEAKTVLDADPAHPYAKWVTTYDSQEFQDEVLRARELTDTAAEKATDAEREAMVVAFGIAARYELMFWDTALYPQPWPA
ncbi:TenA family protein [Antrihabitans sp. YC2-6]|uniref:TenA family protein n=1 Tax=Antrihabitans sp. YC2-6 TaxID=2799498 RepID=UPI0018F4D270|nr:TenA family protein [Antrihabitans sp. YC2-6]MBJ8348084.1 TenA family protein [Antrihabitans sp. YC2-6]